MSRTKPVRLALIGLMLIVTATFGGLLGSLSAQAESSKSADRNGFLLGNPGLIEIEGGTVSVFNQSGEIFTDTTLADGFYEFKSLPFGNYIFLYESEGYLSQANNVLVTPSGDITLEDVTLELIGTGTGSLDLTIEDGDGTPLSGVEITLESLDQTQASFFGPNLGHPSWVLTTDGNGQANFRDLAAGEYRAMANPEGYYPAVATFTTVADNATVGDFNLTARNNDINITVRVKHGTNVISSADIYMYQFDSPAFPGEKGEKRGGSSYLFHPLPGKYLITAAVEGYHTGLKLIDITTDTTEIIQLTPLTTTNQAQTLTLADWNTLTWTTTTDHSFDDGRQIGSPEEGMTGLLLPDIDRIWGDNDGNVTQAEMDAYEAWEQAWDVSLPLTDGQLDVNDAGYSYQPGSFSYSINYPLGGNPSGEPVDSTASFSTTTAATYTASQEDQDTYTIELWVANSQGSDFPYNYSYHLDWPTDFETTDSSSQGSAKATITGTPDSDITTTSGTAKGGLATFTVMRNVLPEPVIDITTDLNRVDFIDGDGELVELWVVQSGTQVNFSAANSDDTVEITDYQWTFTGAQDSSKTGAEANTTFAVSDTNVTVTLTLSDAHGDNGTTVTIYVDDTAPEAAFNMTVKATQGVKGEPYALTNGTSNVNEDEHAVVFDAGNSTDPFLGANSIVSYDWVFSDNWTFSGGTNNPFISRTFDDPGDYTVTLTITDAAGNTDSLTESLTVNDITDPEPAFTWCGYNESGNCTPEAGEVSWPIQFNASTAVDNSGTIVSYNWSVAKSEENVTTDYHIEPVSEDSMVVNITFLSYKDGGYTVTLTVNDSANNTAQFSRPVVPARPFRPDLFVSDITRDIESVTEGDEVTFTVEVGLQGKDVESDFQVSLYLDEADEAHLLANRTVTADNINSAEGRFVNLSFTWKAEAGDHTFIALVDSGQAITEGEPGETQETKNTLTDGVFVEKEEIDTGSGTIIYGVLAVVAVLAIGGYYLYNRGRFDRD